MITDIPRDRWQTTWRFLTSDSLLAALLLATAAELIIAGWLPQAPLDDPVAHAQWLSESQARFGQATSTMEALSLFAITRSPIFRALLSLLAGCLLLRLIEVVDQWRTHRAEHASSRPPSPWATSARLLAHVGALVLLAGLFITHTWGWQVTDLIVQGDTRIPLAGTEEWVSLDPDTHDVLHSTGIIPHVHEQGPGVTIRASDSAGTPVSLQKPTEADPVIQLEVALNEEQYLAVPEERIIIQLTVQSTDSPTPYAPVLVQAYLNSPNQPAASATIQNDQELVVGDVTLTFARMPYARLTATHNPGLWPTGAGLVLLALGVMGCAAWSWQPAQSAEEET